MPKSRSRITRALFTGVLTTSLFEGAQCLLSPKTAGLAGGLVFFILFTTMWYFLGPSAKFLDLPTAEPKKD